MIEQQAIVTRAATQQVWIKSLNSGGCGSCMQRESCGTATLSKLLPKREFAVDCDMPLQVGDKVTVAIDDSHLLAISLLMYLAPVVLMLVVVMLASVLLPAVMQAWLPMVAVGVLALCFFLIHRFQWLLLLYTCFKPQVLHKCQE